MDSTKAQNTETTANCQKDQKVKLQSDSAQQARTSDVVVDERSTIETNKKSPFTTKREMQWQTRMQELLKYHQIHGHCRVPQKYPENQSLGNWTMTMRRDFKKRENGEKSSLTAERIAALDKLGFDWSVRRGRSRHSDVAKASDVVVDERGTVTLEEVAFSGESVAGTTSQPSKKRLFTTKKESKGQVQWQTRMKELRQFRQSNGHCRVPQKYPENQTLGNWTMTVRRDFKRRENGEKSPLTADRIAALNKLGFDWSVRRGRSRHKHEAKTSDVAVDQKEKVATTDSPPSKKRRVITKQETKWQVQWQTRLQELRQFQLIHGHCRVPQKYPENQPLGNWIMTVRRDFKKRENGQDSSLTAENVSMLNKLGFDWSVGRGRNRR